MKLFEFSRKLTSKSEIVVSMKITGSGKLRCISGRSQKFLQKLLSSEKLNFDFLRCFLKFFRPNILEIYRAMSHILCSIQKTSCAKLVCFFDYAQIFLTSKVMALRKSKFLFIDCCF